MATRSIRTVWDLGELPFCVGPQDAPKNPGLPDTLPFVLAVDTDLVGALAQVPNDDVARSLARAYRRSSPLGTAMQPEGLGRRYADDFMAFIQSELGAGGLTGRRLLEIGCGTGYLLTRLKAAGAEVFGVEPGSASQRYAGPAGIQVWCQEFESCTFDRPFDLIVHFAVLEHIGNPLGFCRRQLDILGPGGQIIFGVPDCSEPIAHGDLSMLAHEHWSYFTADGLRTLATRLNLAVRACAESGFGASLYSRWQSGDGPATEPSAAADLTGFVDSAQRGLRTMREFVGSIRARGETLGVFCPTRFLNYSQTLSGDVGGLRFFDDDPNLTGRFFPPLDVPVESREDLLTDPVDNLLIMSRSFGREIAASLRTASQLTDTRITLIEELF